MNVRNKLNPDTAATVTGAAIGLGIGSTVDIVKLATGDHVEIAKAGVSLLTLLFGWLTNRKAKG